MFSLLPIAGIILAWTLTILTTAMVVRYYSRRLGDDDRYSLTELAQDLEKDRSLPQNPDVEDKLKVAA